MGFQEIDWQVLRYVLEALPQVLHNKTLVMSSNPDDVAGLCTRLIAIVSNLLSHHKTVCVCVFSMTDCDPLFLKVVLQLRVYW